MLTCGASVQAWYVIAGEDDGSMPEAYGPFEEGSPELYQALREFDSCGICAAIPLYLLDAMQRGMLPR